jgi:hypothetical protein
VRSRDPRDAASRRGRRPVGPRPSRSHQSAGRVARPRLTRVSRHDGRVFVSASPKAERTPDPKARRREGGEAGRPGLLQGTEWARALDDADADRQACGAQVLPRKARRLAEKLEIHYTPKYGSWLNMAELELSVLNWQCLSRRLPDKKTAAAEVKSWEAARDPCNKVRTAVRYRRRSQEAQTPLSDV